MTRGWCLATGIVLLIASVAFAQPPGGPGPGGQPPFGPGGFVVAPQPGQILPPFLQERLNLTPAQKKQLEELQKETDAKLAKLLTPEQQKMLQEMRNPFPGPGAPGGFGFNPPPVGNGAFGGFGAAGRLDAVKKQIGASDEEWKVIGPKLQKVIAVRQMLTGAGQGANAGFGVPPFVGGPGGQGGGSVGSNAVSQARADLKTVLDDPQHTSAEVQEKVAAVRKAQQKVRGDLEAAQKDLARMLTAEQEAVLVS